MLAVTRRRRERSCLTRLLRPVVPAVVSFPSIPRPRLFRLKRALPSLLREAAELAAATVALAVLLSALGLLPGPLGGARGAAQLAAAAALCSGALAFSRALLEVLYTERVRFLPWAQRAGPSAVSEPLLAALACSAAADGNAFAQHLAMEDLCFVAERGGTRLAAVFDDDSGAAWSAAAKAALRPFGAVTAALRDALQPAEALGGAGGQRRVIAGAVRTLRAQKQLAQWGCRAVGSLCAASRSRDRFGLAQLHDPTVGSCLSELLALLAALRAVLAATAVAPGAQCPLRSSQRLSTGGGETSVAQHPGPAYRAAAPAPLRNLEQFPDAAVQALRDGGQR